MIRLWRHLRLLNATCRDATRLVSYSIDRKLSRSERAGLSIHLAICPKCRRFRASLAFLNKLLHLAEHSRMLGAPCGLPDAAKSRIRKRLG
ncbi:MAG: hypothetical protein JWL69_720 [Phycisphaerales bacterium]|jgi:predicted anti-sigma-YlaC factor YlaD|nr:hypothetical protein [Phycisphaerales bacterium]MDB5357235.1 hypothetical protein [Phycisphaerales bacterium]